MYFHLFQSNNPVLPVENVDSRISLVTTLGWISRVQLLPPSLSLSLPLWPAISIDFYSKLSPLPPLPVKQSQPTEGTILNNRYQWR